MITEDLMLCLKSNTEQQQENYLAIDRVCRLQRTCLCVKSLIADQNNARSRSGINAQSVIRCTGERVYEEIEPAVGKLMSGKGRGADALQPEHLKYKCLSVILWLQNIFNAISDIEILPIIIPVPLITMASLSPQSSPSVLNLCSSTVLIPYS